VVFVYLLRGYLSCNPSQEVWLHISYEQNVLPVHQSGTDVSLSFGFSHSLWLLVPHFWIMLLTFPSEIDDQFFD
jgi:hypothetical protein